jgi:predicted Zn-dependent protease
MLGRQVAEQIRQQSKPVDAETQAYVRRVAARVAPDSKAVVETIVRDSDSLYDQFAVWAPGYVFVSAGILRLARNEAELAGVLAHAMSHRIDRSTLIPMVAGEGISPAREIAADGDAITRMVTAGYSPYAFFDYVERVGRPTPQRLAALKDAVAAVPPRAAWIENTSAFVEAQARALALRPKLPARRPSLQGKIR